MEEPKIDALLLINKMIDGLGVVKKVTAIHSGCILIETLTMHRFTIKSELYRPATVTLDQP